MSDKALFEFHGGLHLRDTVLWFDSSTPRQLCFVSDAGIAGAFDHQKILATEQTAQLLRAVAATHGRGRRAHEPQALVTPYRRPFALGQLSLELFPSGHVLGSASLLVKHQGATIVYAGGINPRRSPLVERLEARTCDVLVLSTPFVQRRFAFPPFAETSAALLRFARDTLEHGATPLFFCSPLGEAQEVLYLLQQAGVRSRVHRQIFAACRVYEQAGLLAETRSFSGARLSDEALIWPIALSQSPSLTKLGHVRSALVSGFALDEHARGQLSCEVSFALSCHADYAGLLEYVRACEPKQVYLLQGGGSELQEDLRALGQQVTPLGPPRQMSMF